MQLDLVVDLIELTIHFCFEVVLLALFVLCICVWLLNCNFSDYPRTSSKVNRAA